MLKQQVGFTLVELMIALALGLVISAAAIMLFITGQKSYSMQQGLSNLQDNANFGLNYMTKDIRLANLNTSKSVLNDRTVYGGVVFTSSVNADQNSASIPLSNLYHTITGNTAAVNLLSRSSGDAVGTAPAWSGVSNVQLASTDLSSDQLVIQYLPQYVLDDNGNTDATDDVWFGGYDCEGHELEFTRAEGRHVIVQRYFLRVDTNRNANEPNATLSLACDAGQYPLGGDPTVISGGATGDTYGDAGEIIIKRVDHFRVLYGIENGDFYRYVPASTYMGLASPRPRVMSIQIGILARSAQAVGNDALIKNDQVFQVLDQAVTVKVPTGVAPKYVRDVITQNISLRNTFGERGK